MARIIETEQGRLVGRVDRVQRGVVWALVCPGCGAELPMSEREFRGRSPVRCDDCRWTAPVYDALAEGEAPRWFDYATTFETVPAAASSGAAA